jgi:glutaminyl-tRNA synthetase
MTMNAEQTLKQFIALGLSEQKAKETLKNVNVTKNLTSALSQIKNLDQINTATGMLIYHAATKIKPQICDHLHLVVKLIVDKKLDTTVRVETALEYLLTHNTSQVAINVKDLEQACGVGIVVTPEQIDKAVDKQIKLNKTDILEQRYRFNVGKILQDVRVELKWADGKAIKNEVDVQIFDLLGAKTEADLAPPPKVEKKPKAMTKASAGAADKKPIAENEDGGACSIAELMRTKVHFHAPGENYKTDGYVVTKNTEKLLKEHLKIINGKVRTRFPPEPNGILHIGHAKAININFGYAAAHDGICFLRYDDTNPEKEEEKFFVGIKDMVNEFLLFNTI